MKLKSLNPKVKELVFKSYDNVKSENPAKIIFSRFPQPDESYPIAQVKNVMDSSIVKNFDNTAKSKEILVSHIIDTMINNITANRVDLKRFFNECVNSIENLEYENSKIITVSDFFQILPEEAAYTIALEAYLYSKESEQFTIDEKKTN
jgi:hypothetical protein